MKPARLSAEAYGELAEAVGFCDEQQAGLGAAFISEFVKTTQLIQQFLFGPSAISALAYARAGRVREALARLGQTEALVKRVEAKGMLFPEGRLGGAAAEADLLLERPDGAQRLAARAAEFSREHGALGYEAEARRALGAVALRRGDFGEVQAQFTEALRVAEELGMRPLAAHCLAGLGRLSLRKGERDQARTHLTTSAAMYREMEMQYWLGPLEPEVMQMLTDIGLTGFNPFASHPTGPGPGAVDCSNADEGDYRSSRVCHSRST